ncbi:adenosylcobinamide-GDP ribazoletransferase [Macellibacteroides fermentans]|uniref:Adenosylcobinamide-GDP ribazoletransferase n=1 Tax=Macellibacteroides fermentans TaxID=879969 RepID=A0A8E1ZVG1_9PORP|nr:adenosylcobinamide-GDP ribazoletransferase [Macellibacteroides fermentans]NYI49214.1 adenosylcobinamide-GDP ribazoletransferase [Macellibacteroides fermentans]
MRILAAFIFFTRLPFWRITSVPGDYFKNVVSGWAMTGWLTAGISAAVLYSSALVFPVSVAILLAIISRLLITGCLHEDGLADFFDGFGGGSDKQKILSIMKDSHIGTYGVVGLVFYFLMLYTLLSSLPLDLAGCAILTADPFAKGVSSMIINRLPYARKEEDSKAKVVYSPMTPGEYLFSAICGLFPLVWLPEIHYLWATLPVLLCWYLLTSFMKKKIGGYTGDCCGALTLLCELSFYIGIVLIYSVTH